MARRRGLRAQADHEARVGLVVCGVLGVVAYALGGVGLLVVIEVVVALVWRRL